MVADEVIRGLNPKRVLDVGCALGFLVESFWDRGVEAWGMDVSSYAIENVRRDMRPYCRVASATEPLAGRYDLITCIEVLEHMPEDEATQAARNISGATDTLLFSSTPYDVSEPTHLNVRPIVSWLKLFQDLGFSPDLGFDASFVATHAILFRRRPDPLPQDVLNLFALMVRQRGRILQLESTSAGHATLAGNLKAAEEEIARASALQDELKVELEVAHKEMDQLFGADGNASGMLDDLAAAVRSSGASVKALDYRLRAIEQSTALVARDVSGVLESKIWRTLVRGGGLLEKMLGRR